MSQNKIQNLFKENKLRRIGWVIAILNIVMMLLSANYFLVMAKFTITEWFFANICFFSTLIFLAGFFLKNRTVMTASIPFLAYFGTGGMFVFSWQGEWLIAQIGHIFMTLAIIYAVVESIKAKKRKQSVLGFIAGLLIFSIFLPVHQNYIKTHPELIAKSGLEKVGNEILDIEKGLPEAWQYRVITEKGKMGSPHGLEEPVARVDFINALDKSEFVNNKNHLSLWLYFYDIAEKQEIMQTIDKEFIYSWCIPVYFDETKKYVIVTSPCYINKGASEDEEAKNFYYVFEQSLKKYFSKFK